MNLTKKHLIGLGIDKLMDFLSIMLMIKGM
jgi:hypothetical protein